MRDRGTYSESEESKLAGVCSALRIVVAFDFEELAVFPRGVGRSEGNTRPVYGAIFATSMIGLIEMDAFLLVIS